MTLIRASLLLLAVTAVALMPGCSKKNATIQSFVRLLNASPNSGALDLRVNGEATRLAIGYDSVSTYAIVSGGGNNNFKLNQTGSSTNVLDANATLLGNVNYTLLAADSVENVAASIIADDVTPPTNGLAKIRLFNLVKGSPPYNISFDGVQVFTSRTYNDHVTAPALAAYQSIDPGLITIDVKLPGGAVVTSLPDGPVGLGGIFTVVISGFTTGSGAQAVHVKLYRDNF